MCCFCWSRWLVVLFSKESDFTKCYHSRVARQDHDVDSDFPLQLNFLDDINPGFVFVGTIIISTIYFQNDNILTLIWRLN